MNGQDVRTTLRISDVIRQVHRAMVAADTREDLETAVCGAFADSEQYALAWIGDRDPATGEVGPRAAAGAESGYLDEISISVDEPPDSEGPTATALRTGTLQVMQHIREDPDYEPWRRQALAHGFESSAAVPVADGTAYGVLNLYSERPAAFSEAERELLAELGETLAAAIDGLEARAELEGRKRRHQQLTERISDAYYAVDADWTITYWNEQMAERTGRPATAVLGESLWEAFPELLGTVNETEYRAAMDTEEPRSFETYLDAPYDYWVAVDVYPDGDGLSVFSREVTDRKEREAELARAKRRLDAIVRNTSEAIYIKSSDVEYLFMNEVGAELFGAEPEELVGATDGDLFDPDSVEDIRADDELVMEAGEPRAWDRARLIDGEKHVFIDDKFPYRDSEGEVVGVMGVSRDITERKRYKQRLKRQRDGLDLLNRVVRHDIRRDLQTVLGFGDILSGHVDAEGEAYLEKIVTATRSGVALTHTAAELDEVMLDPDREPVPVSLSGTLASETDEVRDTADGATVEVAGTLPEATVLADDMLGSVFRNLLKNAVQHNDTETPAVTVSATEAEGYVTVRVADNGPGLPPDLRETIFGKGEKGLGSPGTGVGLYLVRTLVEAYGGDVWVEDNDPTGAVFAVELPTA